MKTVKYVVWGTTLFLFVFALLPQFEADFNLMFLLFLIGNALLIYMVYAVLKFAEPSVKKFNEGHWYEDVDKIYSKSEEEIS
jgi:hypothetical protein